MIKKVLRISILLVAVLIFAHGIYAQACCNNNVAGDANCDGKLSLADFEEWRRAFRTGGSTSPAPTTPPSTDIKPVGVPGTFELAFQDEFNGTTLDTSKWSFGPPWGNGSGQFCQGEEYFTQTDYTVSGGNLNIYYRRRANPINECGIIRKYNTVMVQSKGKVTVRDGQYIEWRLKPALGQGFWSIAWIMPNSWPAGTCAQRYEMDVFEHLGKNGGTTAAATTHIGPNCQLDTDTGFGPAIDYTKDFHTAGVNWFPDRTEIYFDGKKVFTSSKFNASYNEPGFLMMNGFLGAPGTESWAGPSTSATPAEAVFQIDYVRVWNRK